MQVGTKVRINADWTEHHGMTGIYLGPYYGYANVKLDATGRTLAFGKREVEEIPSDLHVQYTYGVNPQAKGNL